MPPHLKRCTKCKRLLPRTSAFFHRRARTKDGFNPRCAKCMNTYSRSAYPKHRDKAVSRTKAWAEKHPKRHDANKKRWLNKNRAQHNASVRVWDAKNQTARRAIEQRWAKNNPEKIRAKVHRQRARRLNAEGSFTHEDVLAQLKQQKNLCFWCAAPLTNYHVDHVIPLAKGGTNYPSNIVCACPGCNLKKSDKLPDVFLATTKEAHRAHV